MPGGRDIERVCYAGRLPPWKLGVPAEEEKEGWEADRGAGREACGAGSGVMFGERIQVMGKDTISRVKKERELYNKGIDRKKYNAHFGRDNWGTGMLIYERKILFQKY